MRLPYFKYIQQQFSIMKRLFIIVFIALVSNLLYGQDFSKLTDFEFDSKESYKTQETNVLSCANYLFNNPVEKDNELKRLIALQFIIKWMEGTPDYTFNIGNESIELTKGNQELFGLYLAGITKTGLENKESLTDKQVYLKTKDLLVEYCANKDNNMKPSKAIKKIIKSKE